ncbi:MAG: DUF3418 domain-containing protein, partial [Pseudomonadota bacterium]|nr:DUF3418 domain-containing protein [Pseudomonadota bacterium]
YDKLKASCGGKGTTLECRTLQRMTGVNSQMRDDLALPEDKVIAHYDVQGKVVSYTLLDKGNNQPWLVMEPLEFQTYREFGYLARDVLAAAMLATREVADIRSQAAFAETAQAIRPRLSETCARLANTTTESIAAAQRLSQALNKTPAVWKVAVTDLREQLDALVFPGFLVAHPGERLAHLPRYLKAMELRLAKLPNQPARDSTAQREMAPLLTAWRNRVERQKAQGQNDPALDAFRWQLEELRVSLFAQELKTPEPVSVKRLEKRWAEIIG